MSDFKIKWKGSEEDTSDEIIVSWVFKKLKAGIPITIIIYGHSQVGKSMYILKFQDELYSRFGIDFLNVIKDVVMIKPVDWGKKARAIFSESNPLFKITHSLHMDEAKFLLNASDWQKLKNRTIRTISATSGAVKPILFIIVAQLLKDVDPKTRETCDLIMKVTRSPGNKPSIVVTVPVEKVIDLSTIKIQTRGFNGDILYPDGRSEHVYPVFRPSLPRKEIIAAYRSFEKPDKLAQIFSLFDELDKETEKIVGVERNKIKETAEFLLSHPEELQKIALFKRNKYKLGLTARKRFEDFTDKEVVKLQDFINDELKLKAKTELNNEKDFSKKELDLYGLEEPKSGE